MLSNELVREQLRRTLTMLNEEIDVFRMTQMNVIAKLIKWIEIIKFIKMLEKILHLVNFRIETKIM